MQCSSMGPFTFSHTHKHKMLWSATGYVLSDNCLNKLHLNACMSACVFVCVCASMLNWASRAGKPVLGFWAC